MRSLVLATTLATSLLLVIVPFTAAAQQLPVRLPTLTPVTEVVQALTPVSKAVQTVAPINQVVQTVTPVVKAVQTLVPSLPTATPVLKSISPSLAAQTPTASGPTRSNASNPTRSSATPSGAAEPTAGSNATPDPTSTATPEPTSSPTAAPATSSTTAIDGVPLCGVQQPDGSVVGPKHDPTRWHPLVVRRGNGAIVCTYGHEHGADPHVLDSTFGKLDASIPGGQEIGYAWQTSDAENSTDPGSLSHSPSDSRPVLNGKHTFFKWEVLTPDDLAQVGVTCSQGTGKSFDSIRMEVHADANAGADIRFHSFYVQAQECSSSDSSYHGQIKIGGHFDYGILNGTHADSSGSEYDVRIPLPNTDPCTPGSTLPDGSTCPYVADRRTHGASGPGPSGSDDPHASLPGYPRPDFTWYGHNGDPSLAGHPGVRLVVSDGIREQDWGPVDPNNPGGSVLFYGPGHDHGHGGIDILDFIDPDPSDFPSDQPATLNADGTYSWSGWVDIHGFIQATSGCDGQSPSTSCIPAELSHVKPGEAQFSNDNAHVAPGNFDVVDSNGVSLIGYPN